MNTKKAATSINVATTNSIHYEVDRWRSGDIDSLDGAGDPEPPNENCRTVAWYHTHPGVDLMNPVPTTITTMHSSRQMMKIGLTITDYLVYWFTDSVVTRATR